MEASPRVVLANLEGVKEVLNGMNDPRHEMLNALNKLQETINNTTDWQGVDRDTYIPTIETCIQQLINCEKWMNEMCYQMTNHANKLIERAIESAKAGPSATEF